MTRIYAGYALLCAIWGTTWMAIRVVVRDVPPIRACAVRFFLAALFILAIALIRKAKWPKGEAEWLPILTLSLTMMALPYGLLFWAEQFVTSSMTAVLFASHPLLVALLTPLMLGKRVPRGAVLALVVAIGAMAYLFYGELSASHKQLIGGLVVLAAVCCSSFSSVYAKKMTSNIDPAVNTFVQLAVGGVWLAIASWVMEKGSAANWTTTAIAWTVYLAVFGSAVAFAIYYWLLKQMPAYKLSTFNLITPFVAIVVGILLLKEAVNLEMLVCSAIVLGCVGFVLKAQSDESIALKLTEEAR
jgi:drug/metabolite transporter (DMT)-like permease